MSRGADAPAGGAPSIHTQAERRDLADRWDELVGAAWPQFMYHDPACTEHWHTLDEQFAAFQFVLHDEESDALLGWANAVPFAWDGEPATLPDGVHEVLPLAVEQHARGVPPTALSALQAVVAPAARGRRLSGLIIGEMARRARAAGLDALVAPVRPTEKHRYPLVPMARYMAWRRDDGLHFDPWIRLHERLGGVIVREAPGSMRFPGTVAEWESWAGMAFPESGEYVVPGALAPVSIDRERDRGLYVEPNVWMLHRAAERGDATQPG